MIIRTRLCMNPVSRSWRIPASTIGKPVRPSFHAAKARSASRPSSTSMVSKSALKFHHALRGQAASTPA